eukprot:6075999-Pyramimonas_sp.AAC.1
MHSYCSWGLAWHAGIHERALEVERPDWAHGGLKHRSRESAPVTLQSAQWSCRQAQLLYVTINVDCTNAFASTRREVLEATVAR